MNFEQDLKANLERLKKGEHIWKETEPYINELVDLNENRIFTSCSQPSMVGKYVAIDNTKCIEIYRSFLWFFIEINDKNNKFLENLKKRKNTYMRITRNNKTIYGNFPEYSCQMACFYGEI